MEVLRVRYLDGLRAIAVLTVIIFHAHTVATLGQVELVLGPHHHLINTHVDTWLDLIFLYCSHGVDLFFVISGFCLSFPVLRAHACGMPFTFNLSHFWAKRTIRIIPPFWVAAAIFVALTFVLLAIGSPLPEAMVAVTPWDIARQFLFFDHGLIYSNKSFWTLAVEARWYVVFPFILWVWIKRPRCFWLLMVLSFGLYHLTRVTPIDLATLPAFMLGIVAADLRVRGIDRSRLAAFALPIALAIAIALNGDATLQDELSWQIVAFLFVIIAGFNPFVHRALSWWPLVGIGVASYSIYLYHQPFEQILIGTYGWAWTATLPVALAIGFLMWFMVERKVMMPSVKAVPTAKIAAAFDRGLRWLGLSSSIADADPFANATAILKKNEELSPQSQV